MSFREDLQELTADISKLVKLTSLDLEANYSLEEIPESFSCLQKLEFLRIEHAPIEAFPVALGTLGNLQCLCISYCSREDFVPNLRRSFLPNLQVTH